MAFAWLLAIGQNNGARQTNRMDLKKATYKQEYHFNGNTGLRKGHPRSEGLGNLPKSKKVGSPVPLPQMKGFGCFYWSFLGGTLSTWKIVDFEGFFNRGFNKKKERKAKERKAKNINLNRHSL